MHRLATLAAVGVLAAASANCSNAREGANSANEIFPLTSVVAPSSHTEARAPGNGNGNGKGGNSNNATTGSSSLDVDIVNDVFPDGYSWGDTVTFEVFTDATNSPIVDLTCSQNGGIVYSAQWPLLPTMTLSSRAWQGGEAQCTATLYYVSYPKSTILNSVNFVAAG